MNQIEVMRQALDALYDIDATGVPVGHIDSVIDALRLAIEQAERVKRAEEAFAAASEEMKGEQAERQEPGCDKDPRGCWNVRCQLGKVCKSAAPPQCQPLTDSVREMRDVQGADGNWNYDPYMHGLYNGLEFAVSLLEQREPKFKDAPKQWLCDLPKPRIFSNDHGIGGGE